MLRQIIKIDRNKCNGCGICIAACHEGAITIENNKAVLVRDDYCDGLGNCLPACPMQAISFETREALPFDETAVKQNQTAKKSCTGSQVQTLATQPENAAPVKQASRLRQWPVQIQLAPVQAAFFQNCSLLIAADCTAYAYANFHSDFIKDHVTLIGCPKLDVADYTEKLTAILKHNQIGSIKIARMEVPCCGGIEHAVLTALKNCQKNIPHQTFILSLDGEIKLTR